MQLFINEEKVDFTLEGEKTLKEVVRSIEHWLQHQKLVIVGLAINQKEYNQETLDKNGAMSVPKIREIRLSTSDFPTLEREGIATLADFFHQLRSSITAMDNSRLTVLLDRFSGLSSTVAFIFPAGEDSIHGVWRTELEKLFTGATVGMLSRWDVNTKKKAVALCENLLALLEKKRAAYEELEHSSQKITGETLSQLRARVARLNDVPVLLQTGKDLEAMQAIAAFSDLTRLFLGLVAEVVVPSAAGLFEINGENFERYSLALNTHLRELIDAFEKKDYILIGDLCEYEIAPKVTALIDTVEQFLSS